MKAKKAYGDMDVISDDDYEDKEIIAKKDLDMALTLNSIFMVLNFLVLGTTLDKTSDNFVIITIILLTNTLAVALFEIEECNSKPYQVSISLVGVLLSK